MIFTLLQFTTLFLERAGFFESFRRPADESNPDKETTCCVFPLNAKKLHLGTTLHYLEAKGFKIVGIKTKLIMLSDLYPEAEKTPMAKTPIPATLVAIQGKDSIAMLYNFVKQSGYQVKNNIRSESIASPVFCPTSVTEARRAIDQHFPVAGVDLHDWKRSADWYIVRENC